MTSTFPRRGILAALWTPLDTNGRLLKPAIARHIRFLKERGVDGILALGSTGEFVRLSQAQREAILAEIVELADPLPVVANISSIRHEEARALGKSAKKLGACGVALMPPSFFPVSQADMLEFFLRATEGVGLPIALYNFPELTSNRIGLQTIEAFSEQAKMVAIKQSGGEFEYHKALIRLGRKRDFSVFSGADTRLPEVFALGASGCVGGLVNFVPELMVSIYRRCCCGAPGSWETDAARMKEVGQIVERLTFPLNVAAGIEARGLSPGAPKAAVSKESAKLYRSIEARFRKAFKKWDLSKP